MGASRPFSIRSLDAFDDLMNQGYSVEVEGGGGGGGKQVRPGCRVVLNVRACTWDGANTITNPFADTHDSEPLSFTVGAGQVTGGLDGGVLSMKVGNKGKITVSPNQGYGDSGYGTQVPPNSHLVYEIEVLDVIEQSVNTTPTGPQVLLGGGSGGLNSNTSRTVYSGRVSKRFTTQGGGSNNSELSTDTLSKLAMDMGVTPTSSKSNNNNNNSSMMSPIKESDERPGHQRNYSGSSGGSSNFEKPRPPSFKPHDPSSSPSPSSGHKKTFTAESKPPISSPSWQNPKKPTNNSSYQSTSPPSSTTSSPSSSSYPTPSSFYPLEELKEPPYPSDVDPANREDYLSESEFSSLFGLPRSDYKIMPKWKKQNLKKKHGLF